MRARSGIAATAMVIAACAPLDEATGTTGLPFFGDGYPNAGDPCRRLGESSETVDDLDHTADLIACPETMPGLQEYIAASNAREIMRRDGHVVLSVPSQG